jgi:hypothetical protein
VPGQIVQPTFASVIQRKTGSHSAPRLACIPHRPSTHRRHSGFRLRERDEAASAESLGASAHMALPAIRRSADSAGLSREPLRMNQPRTAPAYPESFDFAQDELRRGVASLQAKTASTDSSRSSMRNAG